MEDVGVTSWGACHFVAALGTKTLLPSTFGSGNLPTSDETCDLWQWICKHKLYANSEGRARRPVFRPRPSSVSWCVQVPLEPVCFFTLPLLLSLSPCVRESLPAPPAEPVLWALLCRCSFEEQRSSHSYSPLTKMDCWEQEARCALWLPLSELAAVTACGPAVHTARGPSPVVVHLLRLLVSHGEGELLPTPLMFVPLTPSCSLGEQLANS